MEVGTGALRGMGVAMRSMITCLIGACGVRLVMTMLGAPYKVATDLIILYKSYPVSWTLTTVALGILFFVICRNREKEWEKHKAEVAAKEALAK